MTVTAPSGEAAHYTYDPAGNILSIERYAAGTLAILDFSPTLGSPGQLVTVAGVGFSAVASENLVQLNGVAAIVVSSTSAQFQFIVPDGATTGPISVTVTGTTATSAASFSVVASGVSISGVAPVLGKVGTAVTITGSGFDTVPIANVVRLGSKQGDVASATATTLQTTITARMTTGKFSVANGNGNAVSADDFFVLPGSWVASDVISTAHPAIGAATTNVSVNTAGKAAVVVFDAVAGQAYSLYLANIAATATFAMYIYAPDGSLMSQSGMNNTSVIWYLGILTQTGPYTVVFKPSSGTLTLNLQVFTDLIVPLQIDGPAVSMTLPVGQVGRYAFSGTANDLLGFGVPQVTITPPNANIIENYTLIKPDGSGLQSFGTQTPSSTQLSPLPVTGPYSILVSPTWNAPAPTSTTVLLSRPLIGTLISDGSLTRHQTARVGQAGRYTFSANGGDGKSLRMTFNGTYQNGIAATFYRPDGSLFWSLQYPGSGGSNDQKVDLFNLPAAGAYLVKLEPFKNDTGAIIDLRLWPDIVANLDVDGSPSSISVAAGQNGAYRLAGAANDVLSVGATALSLNPTGGNATFGLVKPDGTGFAWCTITGPSSCQFAPLPVTGTYTLRFAPSGTAAANVTTVLSRPLAGTLAADGTPTRYQTTRVGQTGRYTFSATAGQNMSLRVTIGGSFPNRVNVYVYKPDGSQLTSTGTSTTPFDTKVDLTNLPVTGTYTVSVVPAATDVGGTVDLALFNDLVIPIDIDGAAAPMPLAAGQNGRYAITGSANDLLSFGMSSFTLTPAGGNVILGLMKPDGNALVWCTMTAAGGCQFPALPVSGAYSLRVVPSGTAAANLTSLLSRVLSGVLSPDGTALRYQTTRVGQSGRYTFSATAGQSFTLRITVAGSFPNKVYVNAYRPDNSQINSLNFTSAADAKMDLGNLYVTQTGVYTVLVTPTGTDTGGTVDLALWGDAVANVTVDGSEATVTVGPGQNGRFNFAMLANDTLGLGVTAVTQTGGGTVTLVFMNPNGQTISTTGFASPGSYQMPWAGPAGNYSLRVIPAGFATASMTVVLSRNLLGTIPLDGTTVRYQTARMGQAGRYTFQSTAGVAYSMRATVGAPFPNQVKLHFYRADGTGPFINGPYNSNTDIKVDFGVQPSTGTCTVMVYPAGTDTGGTVDLGVWPDATGSIAVDGAETTLSLGAAQNGRLSFSANANDTLGLGVTAVSQTGGGAITLVVLMPNGGTLTTNLNFSSPGSYQIPWMSTGGTYTLRVLPAGTASASVTVLLSRPLAGTLLTDGTLTRFQSARMGQTGRYSLAGTSGQGLSLESIVGPLFPSNVTVQTWPPSGGFLSQVNYASNSDAKQTFATLSATGTYVVTVTPGGTDTTGTVDLRPRIDATGSVQIGGAAATLNLGAAQNGRFTFTGAVNDLLAVNVSQLDLAPSGNAVVSVVRSDGWVAVACTMTAPATCTVPALPSAGTWTVKVVPSVPSGTATVTAQVARR